MLSPSAIQRADDLVGIAMPIAPLSWAAAGCKSVVAASAATASIVESFFNSCLLFLGPGCRPIMPREIRGHSSVNVPDQYLRLGNSLAATSIGKTVSLVTMRLGRV